MRKSQRWIFWIAGFLSLKLSLKCRVDKTEKAVGSMIYYDCECKNGKKMTITWNFSFSE